MKLETLNERIAKAEEKIQKKLNTIEKKTKLIEKKRNTIISKGGNPDGDIYQQGDIDHEIYWLMCDIGYLEDDIKRGQREIEETKKTLEKYKSQLGGAVERDTILKSLPDNLKTMQNDLVEEWDAWDKQRRERLRKLEKEMDWREFHKKVSFADREFMYKTDEDIHKENMRDAEILIIDLVYRVRNIVGEITDWSNVYAEQGSHGFAVLNGYVIGTMGRCKVESILAGGYNIQRLHVRVLTHEFV